MFILNSYFIAVLFCFITMLCWGSWANTQKLSGQKWPFQLFYWDYSFGILFITVLLAFTLGSSGSEGRSFLTDIQQADASYMTSALLGGIIFNIANLLLVIAIEISGMAIAFPIGIGLALVLGVISNYDSQTTGNPLLLMLGVGCIVLAILLDAIAYKSLPAQNNQTSRKGILFSLLAGISMGFFYKYVAASMVTNFVQPEVGKLTPYSALVIFAVGIVGSNFIFNTYNMYKPLSGRKVSFREYFQLGTPKLHMIGILGGSIWGIGMSFNILASEQAGPAIAYGLGQGATLVAAIWGVFIWKEFKELPKQKNILLYAMFISFVAGISLIVYSK